MSRSYLAIYLLFCALIAAAVWMFSYSLILLLVWKDGRILHLMTTSNPLRAFPAVCRLLFKSAVAVGGPFRSCPGTYIRQAPRRPSACKHRPTPWRRCFPGHGVPASWRLVSKGRAHLRPYRSSQYPAPKGRSASPDHRPDAIWQGCRIRHSECPDVSRFDDRHRLKGEIFELTAGYRNANGHRCSCSRQGPEDASLESARLRAHDRGSRTIDIQNMAAILIPEAVGSENAVWQGTPSR